MSEKYKLFWDQTHQLNDLKKVEKRVNNGLIFGWYAALFIAIGLFFRGMCL